MTQTEILEAAKLTLTLMTAHRLAEGMVPEQAFQSALASFLKMCEEG